MFVSMLCDLDMVVVFGKYCCIVLMESDNSKVFEVFHMSTGKSFRRLAMASTTWSCRHEEFEHACKEEACHWH